MSGADPKRAAPASARCQACGGKPGSPKSIFTVVAERPSHIKPGKRVPAIVREHLCPAPCHSESA